MLFNGTIGVCFENCTKHTNTQRGKMHILIVVFIVPLGFKQLSTELLKLETEVEMRSCDLFSCIFLYRGVDKKSQKIPSRLTDSWGSGLTSSRMAPECDGKWELILTVGCQQVATMLL
jgi:hypothetical protein